MSDDANERRQAMQDSEYHAGFRDWFDDNPTGGGEEALPFRQLVDGLWLQDIQLGTGNAMTLVTDEGLVQVDTGLNPDRGREMIANIRAVSDLPIYAIVYSHGHIAYNDGMIAWLEHAEERGDPRPRLIAHENVPKRYARYRDAMGYQERTTEWQFGFEPGSIHDIFGPLIDPDETHRDGMTLTTGSRRVELLSAPAEFSAERGEVDRTYTPGEPTFRARWTRCRRGECRMSL